MIGYNLVVSIPYYSILFPLIRVTDSEWQDSRTDKFYQWVMNQLVDKTVTLQEVKETYDRLIKDCKALGLEIISE